MQKKFDFTKGTIPRHHNAFLPGLSRNHPFNWGTIPAYRNHTNMDLLFPRNHEKIAQDEVDRLRQQCTSKNPFRVSLKYRKWKWSHVCETTSHAPLNDLWHPTEPDCADKKSRPMHDARLIILYLWKIRWGFRTKPLYNRGCEEPKAFRQTFLYDTTRKIIQYAYALRFVRHR